ncbi:hypothetical protein B9Z55_000196 [Caenorhabditis nigoni]|uniref:DUF38 domain-containing protein n=1 Tax=Caenorhabditis nigoni TaxID=1611254 RepID=A0A2G5VIG5_9PELO|nr:hypothetical protein B9Z55_000196 [Caenorhabditis nigoni]
MGSKPLLFCDTKTVLTYMEPNFRFNLALKIPSIRKAEKAAPLHINRLKLEENRFIVNETEYTIRVYQECQAKTKAFGGDGEVEYDLDDDGYEMDYDENIQPGDMVLAESRTRRRPKLRKFEYECSRDRCNHYIRLYESGSMHQFPYAHMKIYQLMKRLLTIFFGNRNGEWTVNNMILEDRVLRWPEDTRKPSVENIEIGSYSPFKLNAVQSLIDSSIPLASIKMGFSVHHLSDHPLLKNAEHLIIPSYPAYRSLPDLFSLQIQKMSITTGIQVHHHEILISKLMEKPRPIGVRYSFLTYAKEDLSTLDIPDVLEISTDYVQLAMGSEAVVVVQYTEDDRRTWLNMEVVARKI